MGSLNESRCRGGASWAVTVGLHPLLSGAAGLREPALRPLQLVHLRCHHAHLQALGFPHRGAPHSHRETVLQQLPW